MKKWNSMGIAYLLMLFLVFPTVSLADTKIRIGNTVTTDVNSLALFYALKNGAFKKVGLDVEVKSFVQSSQKYDAFKAGAIDIDVNMGAINAAQLHSAGVPVTVLRAVTTADMWQVIVRKDSSIKSVGEFKSKRFGVVSVSGVNFGVSYFAFKTAGLDLGRDVRVVSLPPSGLIAALEKGELDGGTLYEPHLTTALKTGQFRVLAKPEEMYQRSYGEPFFALVVSVNRNFYSMNKAAVTSFVGILEKALADVGDNLDAATLAVAEGVPELGLKAGEIKEIIGPYTKRFVTQQNEPALLEKVQNYYNRLYEIKQLKEPAKVAEFWVKP